MPVAFAPAFVSEARALHESMLLPKALVPFSFGSVSVQFLWPRAGSNLNSLPHGCVKSMRGLADCFAEISWGSLELQPLAAAHLRSAAAAIVSRRFMRFELRLLCAPATLRLAMRSSWIRRCRRRLIYACKPMPMPSSISISVISQAKH